MDFFSEFYKISFHISNGFSFRVLKDFPLDIYFPLDFLQDSPSELWKIFPYISEGFSIRIPKLFLLDFFRISGDLGSRDLGVRFFFPGPGVPKIPKNWKIENWDPVLNRGFLFFQFYFNLSCSPNWNLDQGFSNAIQFYLNSFHASQKLQIMLQK